MSTVAAPYLSPKILDHRFVHLTWSQKIESKGVKSLDLIIVFKTFIVSFLKTLNPCLCHLKFFTGNASRDEFTNHPKVVLVMKSAFFKLAFRIPLETVGPLHP